MAQTLRDWYRYLEKQMHVSLEDEQLASPEPVTQPVDHISSADPRESRFPNGGTAPAGAAEGPHEEMSPVARAAALRRQIHAAVAQPALPIELGAPARPLTRAGRRGGRRPITATRGEIIRRLLDPELTLHEAAAVLNLSKATVRRYTDQGKLACLRTRGGQRRFRLSALLAFLETQALARGEA